MKLQLSSKEKYHNVITDINTKLGDLIDTVKSEVNDYYKNNNRVDTQTIKPCGLFERQPVYSAGDEAIGNTQIDEIIDEIKNDKVQWGNLQEISPDAFNVGTGRGNQSGRTEIKESVYPKWLNEIENEAKLFFRWGKSRDWYDEESLVRGLPRRKKVKKNVRTKTLFVLLDVSGSMWQGSYRGTPLIELMIEYFPAIANKFEGEIWEVDDGSPTVIIPLKELRGSKIKEMALHGGGGTNYDEAFRMIRDKKKLLEAEGKSAEFMTIVFTDGEVRWNKDLLPDNLLIVAPRIKEGQLPKDDKDKNRKAVFIEQDSK